jgi:hypothetical protein
VRNDVFSLAGVRYGKAFKLNQWSGHFRHFGLNLLRLVE